MLIFLLRGTCMFYTKFIGNKLKVGKIFTKKHHDFAKGKIPGTPRSLRFIVHERRKYLNV